MSLSVTLTSTVESSRFTQSFNSVPSAWEKIRFKQSGSALAKSRSAIPSIPIRTSPSSKPTSEAGVFGRTLHSSLGSVAERGRKTAPRRLCDGAPETLRVQISPSPALITRCPNRLNSTSGDYLGGQAVATFSPAILISSLVSKGIFRRSAPAANNAVPEALVS